MKTAAAILALAPALALAQTIPQAPMNLIIDGGTTVPSTSWPQPAMSGMVRVNEAPTVVINAGQTGLNLLNPSPEAVTPNMAGEFRTTCLVSHMNFDDPLLYPGASNVGRSHHHTYFGNTASSATVNLNNLRSVGRSTCSGGDANKSSYWVPSMIDTRTGRAVRPRDIGVYYKAGFSSHPQDIQPMPVGLKMLSGKGMALVGEPSGRDAPAFHCHYEGPQSGPELKGKSVPACPYTSPNSYTRAGSIVWGQIDFPMCWDGRNLDSADHRSHMANKWDFGGECPSSHPVELPSITFNVLWPVGPNDDPSAWRLSSDMPSHQDGWSFHADWINGWDPEIVKIWVERCLHTKADCHTDNIGDGRRLN